ncbi:hypothetical protein FRC14_003991 [Serendipita sp. 396]|nr:hypothetical protein FRC14_003991 [Serendipita sp. 396]KAG8769898.1 hypothetical protein FRC16_006533 [Serendipita sp. 398]KAG8826373.1 hypothetical protein FRC19_009044 [Serendipita sp. 401]KAG8837593.1 hypothetical protein FRC18_008818 [Serendipita sp. 400]KAG8838314.1 hypothetical protein FRC20_006461 [Serendipita sp. 405]KAG8857769.1 hypothetical protein FRB91_010845 [Serendipita sp. 411]
MAQSISPECTPLKHKYDTCFNAWLESYLSPEVTNAIKSSSTSSNSASNDDAKAHRTRRMAQEYEDKCGAAWKAYNSCVTKAVKEHKLEELIHQARDENPLRELESHLDQTHVS